MKKIYYYLLPCILLFSASASLAQNNFFTDISERSIVTSNASRVIKPVKFRTVSMDEQAIKNFLWSLPSGKSASYNRNQAAIMELPRPDGSTATFRVWESSIQEPGLEAKFPQIRTFSGQGIDDPYATIRFDLSPRGFHAQVLSSNGNGTYYVDPYAVGVTSSYISYYRTDLHKTTSWHCEVTETVKADPINNFVTAACRGNELRTYRLAVANTGEYAQAPGIAAGTNPVILHAAIVTSVNRVVGVYEKEFAVSMVLIANNNVIEYLNAATDPFNGNNNANILINESQVVIDANIGSPNYDIGHTFSTGGGGLAQLNSPCGPSKARGITGSPSPTGDAYDIDYVAHEMGHQFGGNHTMNGCGSSPNSTKYEPGGGTTIQAYAGICGAQDLQPNSDPHFHGLSYDEMANFVMTGGGGGCGVTSPTGNLPPVITAMPTSMSIPVGTPFTLTGAATDPNGDALTYNWEQWDLGNPGAGWNFGATAPPGNTVPLFKSRIPKTTGSRTFPDIAVILANYPANPTPTMGGLKGETLSPVARPMNFRLTVRDNRANGGGVASSGGGGCQSSTPVTITAVGTTPFTVAVPNGGESYAGNTTQTVTWNVAGTDIAPISVANVRISLSIDGGLTYPTVLLATTANDGSESVTIPNTPTTQARIRVEALGNVFFDISNQNWNITAAASGFTFNASTAATVACGSPTTATVALGTTTTGGFAVPINLTATTGIPAGTTVSFSTNPLAPGSSTNVTLNNVNTLSPGTYTIGVQGVAGAVTQNTTVSFVVSPGAAPSITTQPASQTICAGANATFTVVASGTVTYQWQVSTGGGPFTNIVGATGTSYTVTGATVAQNGNQYHVVVSTLCGSATSSNATLTVNAGAAITTQPLNTTTCSGQNATFSVVATGGGLTYQWESAPSCAGPWTAIPGATSASYTATSVTNAMNGFGYRVIVTGACGAPVTSNCATLTVGDAAAITGQPANATVCAGANTSFTVTTTGTVTYQWQVSTGGGPFTNIPGATTATLTLNAITAGMSGNQYHVTVFNCSGTGIISNNATLTVNTPVAITSQPVNVTVCSPAAASFTVGATGSGLTYQWQVSTNGGTTFTNIAGATSATYSIPATTATQNGNQYHVIVTGPCTPAGVTSSNATLTVNTPVSITTQPANTSICLPAASVSISTVATGTGVTYQWQVSTNGGTTFSNIAGANGATLTLSPVTPAMNGNVYQVVLSGACTPNLVSSQATLTVNSPVSITTQPSNEATCTGDDAVFTVAATSSSPQFITYQWQVSINGGPFVNIAGATSNTLTVPGNMVNNGNVYRVIVSGPPCGTVTSNSVTLTVNQRPGVVLAASEYTNITPYVRTSLYATVSPSGPTYIYQWYRNGVLVPTATASSLPIDVDNLGDYSVEVTNAATGCGTTSNTVRVSDSAAQSTELFIYPNPSTGQFQVRYYSATTGATSHMITVYDSKGARVYQKMYPVTRAYERMDVMLDNASAGIYLVELRDASGKKLTTQRVMIQ